MKILSFPKAKEWVKRHRDNIDSVVWNEGFAVFQTKEKETLKIELSVEDIAYLMNQCFLAPGSLFYVAQTMMNEGPCIFWKDHTMVLYNKGTEKKQDLHIDEIEESIWSV